MKKNIFLVFAGCLLTKATFAQTTDPNSRKQAPGALSNTVALGLSFPMGVFSRTHTGGLTLDYSRSRHHYGNDLLADKQVCFAMNAGVGYNVGKAATTAGYEFRNAGYFTMYAAAGIDYKPAVPVNITLTAGPVMSIYDGSVDASIGVNLFWSYFITENMALGPGINYRKQPKTDALWSGTFRASYAF